MTQDKTRPGANDYGHSFDRGPRNRRVTRYRYKSITVDQLGRYVYLRDQEPCGDAPGQLIRQIRGRRQGERDLVGQAAVAAAVGGGVPGIVAAYGVMAGIVSGGAVGEVAISHVS
jgi:hypothetical protein